jgi:nicotinamidase-related amidase
MSAGEADGTPGAAAGAPGAAEGTRGAGASSDGAALPRLLVIDPQRIFADPGSDWASPFWDGAWSRIRALAAHIGPERTVVSRWLPTADRGTSWGEYFAAWRFADVPASDPLYDLVEGAAALTAHPTIAEPTCGRWGPRGGARLGGEAATGAPLLVAGVSTDCCVIATVLAAADAGAHLTVVTDACAASSTENGEAALHTMSLFSPQVRLATTAEVLGRRPGPDGGEHDGPGHDGPGHDGAGHDGADDDRSGADGPADDGPGHGARGLEGRS